MREDIHVKGRRYLLEGRLRVLRAKDANVSAECRGDSGESYALGHHLARGATQGRWWCVCPAKGRCAHLVALQLVYVRPSKGAA